MIVKSDAIVLKTMKYGETSKIVTFFTADYGKVKCIAKGARGSKSKFGSALEPLQVVSTVFYKKENRDLQLVTQADPIHQFKRLTANLETLTSSLSIAELLNRVTHDEQPNLQLFQHTIEALRAIDNNSSSCELLVQGFQMKTAAALGFAPMFDRCGKCGTPAENISSTERVAIQIAKGIFLCPSCNPGGLAPFGHERASNSERHLSVLVSVSAQSLQVLKRLARENFDSLSSLTLAASIGQEVGETLRLYLRYHVEGLKPLNSEQLLNSFSHQEV